MFSTARNSICTAIQSFSEGDTILIAVSELLIEANHTIIFAPNQKIELPDPAFTQPVLHCSHQCATGTASLVLRLHADIVCRSPVTVMSHKGGTYDRAVNLQYDDGGGWAGAGEIEILKWIIPGARVTAAFPERDDSKLVALVSLARSHQNTNECVHKQQAIRRGIDSCNPFRAAAGPKKSEAINVLALSAPSHLRFANPHHIRSPGNLLACFTQAVNCASSSSSSSWMSR